MIDRSASVFDSLSVLADQVRCRLLLLLERRELSVAELVRATQMPQPNVSRHLRALADEGIVTAREEGASNRYSMPLDELDQPVRRMWNVLREQTSSLPAAREDARRLSAVLSERRTKSQAYFSSAAGHWDRIRRELFGDHAHYLALLSLLDSEIVVGDLGTGTGHIAELLAPVVKRVIAVDDSAAMLTAARRRLRGMSNVEIRRGDLAALPVADGELDAAVLFLVLAYIEEPMVALSQVRRVVPPRGRVLVVDMLPHEREDIAREMGHVWRGFSEAQIRSWAEPAGFEDVHVRPLPADPSARGPSLFAAVLT
jgi:ArsR family transcriptional regulator